MILQIKYPSVAIQDGSMLIRFLMLFEFISEHSIQLLALDKPISNELREKKIIENSKSPVPHFGVISVTNILWRHLQKMLGTIGLAFCAT